MSVVSRERPADEKEIEGLVKILMLPLFFLENCDSHLAQYLTLLKEFKSHGGFHNSRSPQYVLQPILVCLTMQNSRFLDDRKRIITEGLATSCSLYGTSEETCEGMLN
jgi:hypothetical protein